MILCLLILFFAVEHRGQIASLRADIAELEEKLEEQRDEN